MCHLITGIPYNAILASAPIQTKSIKSATVYAIGDTIAQRTEGTEIGERDRARIGRSLAAGLIGHGPLSHYWYQIISEDFFNNVLLWTEWWSFIPKVVIDQTLWGPFWNNSVSIFVPCLNRYIFLNIPNLILSCLHSTHCST